MKPEERNSKIEALLTLLEFSLLFTLEEKKKVKENIHLFTDDEIMAFGKVLAYEHNHREELDSVLKSV